MNALRPVRVLDTIGVATAFVTIALLATLASATRADDGAGWPRRFDSTSGTFVIYQPQPEDLSGDLLSARAAFSLQKTVGATPIFGVLWFTEDIAIDRDSSTVRARNFDVTRVRMPDITPSQANQYEHLVEAEAANWDLSGSLDELVAGLASTERERASVEDIDNTPPRIIFVHQPAILVTVDGAPMFEPIEGTKLEAVANTPFAIIRDPASGFCWLAGANLWYRAKDPLGPWTTDTPPAAVRAVVPADTSARDQVTGPPPLVMTATEPTELISIDGTPEYAPLVGGSLLYVTNTESDVFREVPTQMLYVLLGGRWFRAPSEQGPWEYVRGDSLPASFARVPPDSPKGHILASVPGTDQADDAIADAEIPQTSAIRRDLTGFEVYYDGEPQFAPIEGTHMLYAINSDVPVIFADGRYYACDQGVWYVADDPMGPWAVSDVRPIAIDDIPPSCPVYDTRYVWIYDVTPDVVYVGYTPGYFGCYPYDGTVVYGTGYRYRPWRGRHHYYPRPWTWGLGPRYNPYLSRWSFGFSWWSGFLHVGFRWHSGPLFSPRNTVPLWFGPGGFRRPLYANDHSMLRTRRHRRHAADVADRLPMNLYSRSWNVDRVDRQAARVPPRKYKRTPEPLPGALNNVFAGRDGRVYMRDKRGKWKVREGPKWKPTVVPSEPRSVNKGAGRGAAPEPVRPGRVAPQPTVMPSRPAESPPPREQAPRVTRPEPTSSPAQPAERPARQAAPRAEPTQPAPVRAQPAQPAPRAEPQRREPPKISSSPGNLEREYRGRQRSNEGNSSPRPQARPSPPRQEKPSPPPARQKQEKKESPKKKS